MPADKNKKLHILIMDDSLEEHLETRGINPEHMLDGSGIDVDIEIAKNTLEAEAVLYNWAEQGIKPDIVSADVLYGRNQEVGIQQLSRIMDKLYHDTPELKPAKVYVHSKSGIDEGGDAYETARYYMEKLGAEYVHTLEWLMLADAFSKRYAGENRWSPTTNTLRSYLNEAFGLTLGTLTREEIMANERRQAAERVGDDLHPFDAINAVDDGGITPDVALMKISPEQVRISLQPSLNNSKDGETIDYHPIDFNKGTGGAATGVAAFTAEEVARYKAEGKKVILVLENFTPADVGLLAKVDGVVLLGRGSSHLPILCENHGIPGIFSEKGPSWGSKNKALSIQQDDEGYKLVSSPNEIDERVKELFEFTVRSGDPISMGTSYVRFGGSDKAEAMGELYRQGIPLKNEEAARYWWLDAPMQWARHQSTQDWHRRKQHYCHGLSIKANADSAEQVKAAFDLGAQGIGLLRTEHMMMQGDQLHVLQTYMLAEDDGIRQAALEKLKAAQKKEFSSIYAEVKAAEARNYTDETSPIGLTYLLPLPVTTRLFDAKPDEILPALDNTADIARIAADTHLSEEEVRAKLTQMIEQNERGVQFGLKHTELYKAQIEALFEAAKEMDASQPGHHTIVPEIMVPMVKAPEELAAVKAMVVEAAQQNSLTHTESAPAYRFGTMVETNEAVENAAALAKQADFFSFGTNDLTQEVMGLKRDDIEAVDNWMNDNSSHNPFRTLHAQVKDKMQMAVEQGLEANPHLKINVCGHQVATDQPSIAFCQSLNLDAISVPSNIASLVTSSIIAGQEAYRSREAARAENAAWRAAGGKTLLDEGRAAAIDPAAVVKQRAERGWIQE